MTLSAPLKKYLRNSLIKPLGGYPEGYWDARANLGEVWKLSPSGLSGSEGTAITYTRASTKLYPDALGYLRAYTTDQAAFRAGLSVEGASTNQVTIYNWSPDASLTNVTDSANMTTSRVLIADVPSPYKEQIQARLSLLTAGGTNNGYIFKHVASGGAGTATFAATLANTNDHTYSVFAVVDSASATNALQTNTQTSEKVALPTTFGRVDYTFTPTLTTSREPQIALDDGDTAYSIGVQAEEGGLSSPIVTSGTTGTRAADSATVSTTGWAVNNTTIYIECPKGIVETGAIQYLWASQVDGANWTVLFYNSGNLIFQRRIAGVAYNATVPYTADGTPFTVACTNHSTNGSDIHISTGATSTPNATAGDMPLAATARLGAFPTGTFPMFGELKYFAPDITGVNSDLNDLYWAVRNG